MGLLLTCQPVVMAITASISGPLSDRIGSRAPATAGLLIVSVALFLLSRLQGSTPTAQIAARAAPHRAGDRALHLAQQQRRPGGRPGPAPGRGQRRPGTARTLGMVLGIGVAGAVYTTTLGAPAPPDKRPSWARRAPGSGGQRDRPAGGSDLGRARCKTRAGGLSRGTRAAPEPFQEPAPWPRVYRQAHHAP